MRAKCTTRPYMVHFVHLTLHQTRFSLQAQNNTTDFSSKECKDKKLSNCRDSARCSHSRSLKLCVLVYKCLHQAAPIYLSELCIPVASFTGRSHLRSVVKECLVISYCTTKNYGQRSFSYSGPTLWSSLPLTVRDSSMSLSQFCSSLKTEMFCRAYN